jgi:putative holliday junction resolvase
MRQLGLDVGDKRIGIAMSDETGTLASGLPTYERVGPKKDLQALAKLVAEHDVEQVVVGFPKHLNGAVGTQAEKVLSFIEGLKRHVRVPVIPWDERLTSVVAEEALIEAGVSRKDRRGGRVDKVAAIIILQNYLDYRKLLESEPPAPED